MRRLLLLAESFVVWRAWRLIRSRERSTASARRDESDFVLASVSVERAAAYVEGQMEDSDILDLKALGLLTVDAAALTVLIAAHDALNHLWWISGVVLGASAAFLFGVQKMREFDRGPDLIEFRSEQTGATPVRIIETMLSDLLIAGERNLPLLQRKVSLLAWGSRFLAAGVLLGLLVALI